MSDILIKGMEMPTTCESCPCKTADAFGGLGCQATGYIPLRKANQDRPDNCPLVPVPPHGDLIDKRGGRVMTKIPPKVRNALIVISGYCEKHITCGKCPLEEFCKAEFTNPPADWLKQEA